MKIIAESLTGEGLEQLGTYETQFPEGSTGELRVYTTADYPVTNEELTQMENQIRSQGAILTEPITYDNGMISIKFKKAIAPLIIIVGAVIAALGIGGFISWQLITSKLGIIPGQVWIVAGGAILYLIFTSKPAKKAGEIAIYAGKTYITKKTGVS